MCSRAYSVIVHPHCHAVAAPDRLKHWLDTLLWETDTVREDIYRMKGVVHVQGSEQQHMLQAVHEVHDVVEGPAWPAGVTKESRIVIIGRKLNREALDISFRECLEGL